MSLKECGHKYLHELFKAVLHYDAERIKGLISKEVGGRLLNTWVLRLLRVGSARQLPLEQLCPILEEKIKEFYNGD